MRLPDEDVVISLGDSEYFIPAKWRGRRRIVSECGWWIGKISIVRFRGSRWVEWIKVYSLVFDEE